MFNSPDFAIWILIAVILGERILSFLKVRGIDLAKMGRQVNDLHDWHSHVDPRNPGRKIWWENPHLEEVIVELNATMLVVRESLTILISKQKEIKSSQERMEKKYDKHYED